jgi:poly-beta-1,6-N-acetyl-D-glucosamine synthase
MIFLALIIFLFALYSSLILYYWRAWLSVPVFDDNEKRPETPVSIVIPARNEAATINRLLNSLLVQTYPRELMEIIVVDDHSTDDTASIVKQFKDVRLISLQDQDVNSSKKKAIATAIATAKGSLIITTDADCQVGPIWLQTLVAFREKTGSVLVAGPVAFRVSSSSLVIFQCLDFLVLQGITAASVHKNVHSMCNGANLAYDKTVFFEVDGFKDVDHIASGDDMLLMHKIWQRYPRRVGYLKSISAIVQTDAMPDWKSFLNQRIRWASKARQYQDKRISIVLAIVFLFNLSFPALLVVGCWDPAYWLWLSGLLAAKTIVEFPFVSSVAKFFKQRSLMKFFPLFQPFHIAYTLLAGFLGQFGTYTWKGRRVR